MNELGHLLLNLLAGVTLMLLAWPRLRRLGFTILGARLTYVDDHGH